MKKFLSLVLSLVMTMSLVTIGASATDYKNLSDKGEIKYEEAVAVLNKLGIITGYEDGSFKPTGSLTRGAAAKIIVSLMIGPEAAAALTVTGAPYKDVPVTNTFAAVISYCKTAGYINGYTDGTFRPTAALSGFAFTKMLLGAVGYRGDIEGFTGSGWTMNVAKLGKQSGLFDDFSTAFVGGTNIDRESACLLALNTLKATEVEYTANGNNLNVNDKGNIVGASTNYTRSYVTSRNDNINQNISKEKSGNDSSYYTLEFGEEHFADLKLTAEGTAADDFGRPSNQWTYKNVKIGTYASTPDYTYTTEANGDTDNDKVKDMGLKDFYFDKNTTLTVNGVDQSKTLAVGKTTLDANAKLLAGLCKNGTLVEVYLDDDNADTIEAVVVVKSQLMQINSVKSTEVTLKNIEDDGFLSKTVKTIKDDDDAWGTVKDLKADDYVLVVPLKDGSSYKADSVFVPQTVTGKMTSIATKSGNTKVKAVTVAGTEYKMSELWTSEDQKLTTTTKLSSTQDTTVYLDKYGYAIYVKDVTDSNSAIIVDEIYSSLVDGKIVKYAKGWDSKGNELSLNLGNSPVYPKDRNGVRYDESSIQGKVFEYQTSTTNNADYKLVDAVSTQRTTLDGTSMVYTVTNELQSIVAGQYAGYVTSNAAYATPVVARDTKTGKTVPFASDVKFIFESIDDGDVTGITVHEGVTEVKKDAGIAGISYVLNDKCEKIVAVVIANDDDAANTANLLYVQKVTGYKNNADGKRVALFTAYIDGEKVTDCEYTKESLTGNAFYTYSKNETTGVYTLTEYKKTDKITSVYYTGTLDPNNKGMYLGDTLTAGNFKFGNDYFGTKLANTKLAKTYSDFDSTNYYVLNAKNAKVIDLYTDDGVDYTSVKDMKDAINTTDSQGTISGFNVAYIFNGSDNTNAAKVDYVFITKTNHGGSTSGGTTSGSATVGTYSIAADVNTAGNVVISLTDFAREGFVPATAQLTVTADVMVNGVFAGQLKSDNKMNANQTSARFVVYNTGATTSDTVTLENVKIVTDKVNVVYQDKNGDTINSSMTTSTPESITIANVGVATTLEFKIKTTAPTTAYKYTVTQLSADNKTITLKDEASTDTSKAPSVDLGTSVVGTSAVIVKLNIAMSDLAETYNVTAPVGSPALSTLSYTGATAGTTTLGITASRTSGISSGANVVLTATLTGSPAALGMNVTLSNGSVITIKKGATTGTANITVTSDVTLTVTSVADITALPTVTGITVNDVDGNGAFTVHDTFTLTFSEAVTAAPTLTKITDCVVSGVLASDGKSATYTIDTAPTAADDGVTLAADALISAASANTGYAGAKTIIISNAASAVDAGLTLA